MSRETEKVLKELGKYIDSHSNDDLTESDVQRLMNSFMAEYNSNIPARVTPQTAETSDDYMELAYDAATEKDALKYARQALKLDPYNYDAELFILDCKTTDDDTKLVKDLEKKVQKATKHMKDEGYFEEDSIGNFWGIVETRPYMRLRGRFVQSLLDCSMLGRAKDECLELLRLCEGDNLGIRYQLMHIYAYFEDEQAALALQEQYDNYDETEMLLPLSVIYYKKGNYTKAQEYLRRLNRANKDLEMFFKFVSGYASLDEALPEPEFGFGIRPGTIDELMEEMEYNSFLFMNLDTYMEWAYLQVLKMDR